MIKPNPRIAIIRLSALGDIVNSAIILQLIRQYYPAGQIDWYIDESFSPLFVGHPLINNVISLPLRRIKKVKNITLLLKTIHLLKHQEPYDFIIDLQGLLKSAIVTKLLQGTRYGFDRKSAREGIAERFYDSHFSIPYESNVIERNVRLVCGVLNIPYSRDIIEMKQPVFPLETRPIYLKKNRKNIAFIIGGSWESKRYPKDKVAEVCSHLNAQCFIIWGNDIEYADALWISETCSNTSIVPLMKLNELPNFIGHCDLIIGNDTGPTHIGWAMNRHSITLFGPTNERMIFVTPKNIGIKSPSDVNILKIDKHDMSIGMIDPKQIIKEAERLLHD